MELLDPQVEIKKEDNNLKERLAALEHEQWMQWAKELLEKENISPERAERWKKFFVPYNQLPDDAKEDDREWAENVIAIVENEDVDEVENTRTLSMDGTTGKGAEWIPKKMLKPKKKKDVVRNTEVK
jgi:hypothetical protein